MTIYSKILLLCSLSLLLTTQNANAQSLVAASDGSATADKNGEVKTEDKKAEKTVEKSVDQPVEKKAKRKIYSPAISDNSFLIEEAYNQEEGVMQTITTCAWFRRPSNDVGCTITQEFPLKSQKHQLSYTAPVSFNDSNRVRGFGDVLLNYRYQLTTDRDWAAISPRVSLILPTGSTVKGLGFGSPGIQFNMPISKQLSEQFVAHFNAGATFLPKAKGTDEFGNRVRRNLSAYNLGGSVIWLAHKRLNLVAEYVENFSSQINDFGQADRYNERVFNPGARFAIDIGPLQIVPGVSVPTSFIGDTRRTGMVLYLSFEHPFKKSVGDSILREF